MNAYGQTIVPIDANHQLIDGTLYEKLGNGWFKIAGPEDMRENKTWLLWVVVAGVYWFVWKS